MGKMGSLFFGKYWLFFYLCLFVYLVGNLAIYSSAVAKSLRDVICISENGLCWGLELSTFYRLILGLFGALQFILVAFEDVTKNKFIQVFLHVCTGYRLVAFGIMIVLAVPNVSIEIFNNLPPCDPSKISELFGVCIYSFTCHHSLPQIVTPISKKNGISVLVCLEYLTIFSFYLGLALTGISAFDTVNGLYTSNFQPESEEYSTMKGRIFRFFLKTTWKLNSNRI